MITPAPIPLIVSLVPGTGRPLPRRIVAGAPGANEPAKSGSRQPMHYLVYR